MTFRGLVGFVLLLLPARTGRASDIPLVSLLRQTPSGVRVRVSSPTATAFNAPGNLLIGQVDRAIGDGDRLLELGPDGTTAWDCRIGPSGSLTGFFRAADGTTLVTQVRPGAFSRVLVLDREGGFRRGWSVRGRGEEPPPAVVTAQPGADGGLDASVAGYAFTVSRRGRLTMEWTFGKLKSAIALSDGRWLAALARPERFALYDPRTRALATLPLDGFCHVWSADRAEETGPARFRLFGCFCMPDGPVTDSRVRPRLTIEVADIDSGGGLLATYGSPHALRVDEFGTERCATFTRGLVRLPSGGLVLANTYPADCRVEERDAAGRVVRTLLTASAGGGSGSFGEDACPLVGLQRIGAEGTITAP